MPCSPAQSGKQQRPGSSHSTLGHGRAPGSRRASLGGGGREPREKRLSATSGTSSMFRQHKQLQEGLAGGFRQLSGLVEAEEEGDGEEGGQGRLSEGGSSSKGADLSGGGSGSGGLKWGEEEGEPGAPMLRSATQFGGPLMQVGGSLAAGTICARALMLAHVCVCATPTQVVSPTAILQRRLRSALAM